MPDVENCPKSVFNLFRGFNAETLKPNEPQEYTKEELEALLQPILTHLGLLTDDCDYKKPNTQYVLKFLANINQNPTRKAEISILFRDMDKLLTEGGGTGKNLFIEWFGNEFIGSDYFHVVTNNAELYGDFNSVFEGKLLVFVEEASGKDNHSNHDVLKGRITSKKTTINRQNVAQYTVRDYTNFIMATNNRNSLPIKQGNRRFSVFDTNTSHRGDDVYYKALVECMKKDEVKWAFYCYLRHHIIPYLTPIDFGKNIPITNAYIEMRKLNAPIYLKWLVAELKQGHFLNNVGVDTLYHKFVEWVKENREGSVETLMSLTSFGLLIKNDNEINDEYDISGVSNKVKLHGIMTVRWNIPNLVAGLKKLYLLDDNFEY